MMSTTGKTQDAGYQFGIRKTFPRLSVDVWNYLFSEEGEQKWLGKIENGRLNEDKIFRTDKGVEGIIRILKPSSHVRMTWKKQDWKNESRLQVRVIPEGEKTTLSFHQEMLEGPEQREEMKKYWTGIMEEISKDLQ